MLRLLCLLCLLCLNCALTSSELSQVREALVHALLAQQQADGSWRSPRYAMLRDGVALTPVIALALQEAGLPSDDPALTRAAGWIATRVRPDGSLGTEDPFLLAYPTYATASALAFLQGRNNEGEAALRERMRSWLHAAQIDEGEAIPPTHPAHGLWGFNRALPGQPGHVDIAHTCWALEALAYAADTASEPSLTALARMQNADGGFYFSPTDDAANKGRTDADGAFASYASATCDGIRALLACGCAPDDPRVRAAATWLEAHPEWNPVAGIPANQSEDWQQSVLLYASMSRARTLAALDRADWAPAYLATVRPYQQDNGLYANPRGFLMKEDEPLVASALVLRGLAACR